MAKKEVMAAALFLACMILPVASAFDFYGYAHYPNGTNMSGVNITMEIYNLTYDLGPVKIGENSVLSGASGWFNASDVDEASGADEYMYKAVLVKYDSNGVDADYVGKPLPYLGEEEYSNLGSTDFYLQAGATINITAYNASDDPEPFQYIISDSKLNYEIASKFDEYVQNLIIHVPAERNYSFILYFNQTMPVQYEVDNLTDYNNNHADVEFDVADQFIWVSGNVHIDGEGTAQPDLDELEFIGYIMEPGNVISTFTDLPHNMSAWRNPFGTFSDSVDATTGAYNITLIHPGRELDIMMVFQGADYGDETDFVTYQNITIGPSGDINGFNITLYNASGDSDLEIELDDAVAQSYAVSMLSVNFSIQNESGAPIDEAFIIATLDYEDVIGMDAKWMVMLEEDDGGIMQLPLIDGYDVQSVEVFSSEYAPRKVYVGEGQFDSEPIAINLSSFDPSDIDESISSSEIYIDLLKYTDECSVPDYNQEDCSLLPENQTMDSFNPFKLVIGGGKMNFVMGNANNGMEVMYKNVDLLASGPPDVLFDTGASSGAEGDTISELWRFGSGGPEIYDEVLIAIPINNSYDPSTMNFSLPYLYDSGWNVIWNSSSQGNNPGSSLSDYEDYASTYFDGMDCSTTDNSSICYINTTDYRAWIRLPHFTYSGSQMGGQIQDLIAPVVLLNSPADNANTTSPATLVCTAADPGLENATLYHNASGSWAANETNSSPVSGEAVRFTVDFDDGTYIWNCLACDTSGNCAFNSTNNTLNTESIPPSVTFPSVLGVTTPVRSSTSVTTQADVTDASGVASVTANGAVMQLNGGNTWRNTTNAGNLCASEGACTITFNATDIFGNYNDSETTSITIDDTAPAVASISLSSSIAGSNDNFQINATVTDADQASSVSVNSISMSHLGSNVYSVTSNGTALGCSEGTCTLSFSASDRAGNTNASETSSVIIDNTAPSVALISPSDGANISADPTIMSCNVVEANLDNVTLYHNVTGWAANETNISGTNGTITFSQSIAEGAHIWNCLACDSLGRCSWASSNYTFALDKSVPSVTSPSRYPALLKSSESVEVNATVTDTTLESVSVNGVSMSNAEGDIFTVSTTGTALGCTSDGLCTLTFNATDSFGNYNDSVTTSITIDDSGPSVEGILTSASHIQGSVNFQINATVADANTISSVSVNNVAMSHLGSGVYSASSNGTALGCSEGTCTLNFNATDELGNSNTSETSSVIIDDTAPSVSGSANATKYKSTASVRIDVTISDSSPITSAAINNTALSNTSATAWYVEGTASSLIGPEGSHTHNITATDAAGNTNTLATVTAEVDDTSPTITSVSDSAGSGSATITWTTNENCNAQVDYGTNETLLSSSSLETSFSTSQSVSLSSLSSSTVYYYNVTSCDEAGNCNTTGTYNFTTSAPAAPADDDDDDDDSTSRRSSDTYYTSSSAPSSERAAGIFDSVAAGGLIEFSVSSENIDVRLIEIEAASDASNVRVEVEQLVDGADEAGEAPGRAYVYLRIRAYNLEDEDIGGAEIRFRVSREWLTDNNALEDDIVLLRYNSGEWQELETSYDSSDSDYVYFTSETPGFSYFAVSAKETGEPAPEEFPAEAEQPQEKEAEEAQPEDIPEAVPEKIETVSPASKVMKWVVLGIIVIAIIVAIVQNIMEKRLKAKY